MKPSTSRLLAQESADWHYRGLIGQDLSARLGNRYRRQGTVLSGLISWLGLAAVFLLGLAVLALVATFSGSAAVNAALCGVAAVALWRHGVKMATDPARRHPITGSALVTTGLIAAYGAMLLLLSGDDAELVAATRVAYALLFVIAALSAATAYRHHLRWPLLLALLFAFQACASGGYMGAGAYFADLYNPRLVALAGAACAAFGLWHQHAETRVLRLRRYAGFGRLYVIAGLIYFDCALWFQSLGIYGGYAAWAWVLVFTAACLLQIVLGARLSDGKPVGFGVVFLSIDLYTQFFDRFQDRLSTGWFLLIGGAAGMLLGWLFERQSAGKASAPHRNQAVHAELDQLLREGLLDAATHAQLSAQYPAGKWNWRSLGRWFLVFGAIAAAAGAVVLVREAYVFTWQNLAVVLALATLGLLAAGRKLRQRAWLWTGRALELLAAFALIGLTFTLGILYSTGSGNWPALLLTDLAVLLALAYALNNVLLVVLSMVVFFIWFGGATGYDSAWSAYWFGMNYPLRFLGAALLAGLMGLAHLRAEHGLLAAYRGFAKVWIAAGLFLGEMALWLLSLFGNYGGMDDWHLAGGSELLAFNLAWLVLNPALAYAGIRCGMRMLTGYGATFFVIQLYTLFFTQIAQDLGWLLSLLVAGGSSLGLAILLENRRRAAKAA